MTDNSRRKTAQRIFRYAFFAALLAGALAVLAACGSQSSISPSSSSEVSSPAIEPSSEVPEPEPAPEAFYVLVVGNDSRAGAPGTEAAYNPDAASRSDTTMLVRVDPATYAISIVSIPRDTASYIDGAKMKFNEAYNLYGIEGTLDQVEQLTGVRADHTMETTFAGFDSLVDALGGLYVHVPIDVEMGDGVRGGVVRIPAGDQTLNGAEALAFARERQHYESYADATRQMQDRKLAAAAIQKVLDDPGSTDSYVDALYANITTDWPVEDFSAVVHDFVDHADRVRIVSGTGPYDGDIDEESGWWLAYRDEDTWRAIIEEVEAGGDPNNVLQQPNADLYW